MPIRHHGPPKRRLPMTWHAHNNHTPPLHAHPRLRHRDSAAPTGGFTTIDTPPRRVAGVSHPYGRNSPHAPTHNHQPRTHSRPSHDQTQPPTRANGGFTTIDTSPRRVAGVSHPYGRNSPHTPTHNRQPCAQATTQHPAHPAPRPYTTSPPQHSQTPPRLGHTNGGFYYHRHPTTACRRRVTPLWSQFPPRPHPQPPLRPAQTPIAYDLARTQQSHATPARPSAAPPPRLGHANGGFYYHRRLTTACRRRVTALWSQFPPHLMNQKSHAIRVPELSTHPKTLQCQRCDVKP